MSAIKTWSTSAASNNAAPPDGFPENMAPSAVNDAMREVMAQVKTWYDDAEWRDLGHTVSYASATSFTIAADVTAIYTAGRRLRCADAGTLYGIVAASSYSAPDTTVTVVLDSGALSASLSAVAVDILSVSSQPRGWFEINRLTASAADEVDFVLPSGFVAFKLLAYDVVPGTDGAEIWLRTSSDGGSSFDAGGSDYTYGGDQHPGTGSGSLLQSGGDVKVVLCGGVGQAGAGEGMAGEVALFNPAGTSLHTRLTFHTNRISESGTLVSTVGAAARRATADVDAIRVLASSGTLSGTFILMGLRS